MINSTSSRGLIQHFKSFIKNCTYQYHTQRQDKNIWQFFVHNHNNHNRCCVQPVSSSPVISPVHNSFVSSLLGIHNPNEPFIVIPIQVHHFKNHLQNKHFVVRMIAK